MVKARNPVLIGAGHTADVFTFSLLLDGPSNFYNREPYLRCISPYFSFTKTSAMWGQGSCVSVAERSGSALKPLYSNLKEKRLTSL